MHSVCLAGHFAVAELFSLGDSTMQNQLTNDLMADQTTKQNIEPTSGPDQDGPIWGYHFVPNQPARSITSEEAGVLFLTAPGPGHRMNSSGCIFRFPMRLLSLGYGGI